MATKSRTYLPTDWQVWVYQPVSGKFRLDFSALDGADLLGGSTDVGSIGVLTGLNIAELQLEDGAQPNGAYRFTFNPGSLTINATMKTWDSTTIKELYNGKQIFLTLKNEATNSHPIFGKNTVMFIGNIDSLNIDLDPINVITTLTITATDLSTTATNVPISFTKTNSGKDIDVTAAFTALGNAGQISPYLNLSLTGMLSTYEATGTINTTFGAALQDFIDSDVCTYTPYYRHEWTGSAYNVYRQLTAKTISTNSGTGEIIPYSITTGIQVSQDGANIPTAFTLSNSTANYSYGTTTANTFSNPNVYTATLDVPTAFLPTIAAKISQYTQKTQPVAVTVKTAQTFQSIIFDNNEGDYIWPQYLWQNGQEVKTSPTYIGGTYNHTVVGTSHTITPDDWTTTYQLWKGL